MRVRDIDLAVRETGTGRPFVWGHGLLGSMDQEDDAGVLDEGVLGAGQRLVRFDARGHGRSEASLSADDYRWPELARDLLALLDALAIEKAVLGGLSMGCATSLHAAVAAPDRVLGLVLVAPPTAWTTRPRQARFYRLLAASIERLGLPVFRCLAALPRPGPRNPALKTLQRSVIGRLRHADRRAVVSALRGAAASDLPTPRALATLDAPALLLAWRDDPAHPVSTARRLEEILPRTELHVAGSDQEMRSWSHRIANFLEDLPR